MKKKKVLFNSKKKKKIFKTLGYSLSINSGSGGARLTHNHKRQYLYVFQSLTLWADIQKDVILMFIFSKNFKRCSNYGI